ncbi:hypothetical protein ACEQUB_p00782 (plasmid) [Ralstonia syzygii]
MTASSGGTVIRTVVPNLTLPNNALYCVVCDPVLVETDIVWMVKQTVTLADGSQQEVLVPQVYLRARDTDITGGGTLMAGNNVSFQAKGDVTNSGTIASRKVTVVIGDNLVNTGTLAGKTLLAQAAQDINNLGGHIQGDQVLLSAGRDVNLTSTTASTKNATTIGTNISQVASVAAGTLSIQAGRDANLTAAAINTSGDAAITANRDVNLNALRQSSEEHVNWGNKNRSDRASYADAGTQIQSGGKLAIGAGQDVNATAAYANATGSIQVVAGRDANLSAGQSHQDVRDEHYQAEKGFLSTKTTHTIDAAGQTNAVGTTLSGDTVTVAAGRDMTAKAATIAGTGDVNLSAGRDLTVTTADTATSEYHYKDVKKSGLGSAGAGISYGTHQTTDTSNDTVRGSQGSLIGSTDGNVNMRAGRNLNIMGSDVVAAQNVTGVGQNVTIDASTADRHHDETHEIKSSGFTLALKSPVLDAIQNAQQQAEVAGNSQDGRVAALHGIAAAGALLDVKGAAKGLSDALKDPKGKPEVKVELSWGSSSSKSTFTEDGTQHNGSAIKAGGTAAFVATGDGTQGSGNVTIQGSDVNAQNVLLQAKNQVNLVNSTDTDSTRSTNESKSASVGVSYGTGGWGVSASTSKAHGDANSDATTQNNTHINARGTATIVSGGDTNITGANVNADKVVADVGGNLNLASVQDTSHSTAHQSSTGGGFSASMGGVSGSFSHSIGNANGSYAGVNEQAGIQAGSGGFDINVKGNTDLKGAVIASTATPDKNQLTTGTLTWRDISNYSNYSASSSGFGLGGSLGNGGNNYKTSGAESGTNVAGGSPMLMQHASDSQSATTRSAVAQGTITITDQASQKQDVAGLSRDTANTNGKVGKTPDLQNILNNQADVMAAAQAAGETIAKNIGTYADGKKKDAEAAAEKAAKEGNPELAAQYQAEAEGWKEGGSYRASMQAAGAAVVAGLGGGNALAAAAGAGVASLAAGKLNDLAANIAASSPTGNKNVDEALGNLVSNALATTAGAAVGGNAGAFSGYNVDRYNRQLHPDEQKWIKDNAKQFARQQGITEDQAIERLSQQALKQVDYLWRAQLSDGDDTAAKAFLGGSQQTFSNQLGQQQKLFTATDQQVLRPEMFADTADPKFYQRYVQSGINRDLNAGLVKELKDSGINIKNSAVELAKAAKDNPGLVLGAAWDAVKGLPGAIVDGFRESGQAIGEGAAVALNKDLTDKLNAIYGKDVSGYQQALLAIRITVAVTGAATTAKTATGMSEAVVTAVGKKLDGMLEKKALDALLNSGGVLDKAGEPLLDMSKLSNAQKGVMGDLFTENTVKQIVPDGQKLARMPGIGEQGIDDLYKVNRADVDYVIIENKFVGQDPVTGSQRLGSTNDGRQGSTSWITSSDRLERSVGEELAPSVRRSVDAGRTETWVVTTRPDGSTEIQVLDSAGKPKPVDTSKILLPRTNAARATP